MPLREATGRFPTKHTSLPLQGYCSGEGNDEPPCNLANNSIYGPPSVLELLFVMHCHMYCAIHTLIDGHLHMQETRGSLRKLGAEVPPVRARASLLPVRWEELTASDFPAAVKRAKGVCVLPIGVLEKHGPHLPIGTDVMASRALAIAAAQEEYAVVFPWYYFGQINEARHEPGCVSIRPELLNVLLENMCEEISRNGFDKTLIVNGHGGNTNWLNFFLETLLAEPREYVVYIARRGLEPAAAKQIEAKRKTDWGGHADELETSWMMAIRPDLVQHERASQNDGRPRKNLKHLPGVGTSIWWYADFPQHYAGDARPANVELGKLALKGMTATLADLLRAVKKDTTARRLQDEFFAQARKPLEKTKAHRRRR